jgi:hypothetical protein
LNKEIVKKRVNDEQTNMEMVHSVKHTNLPWELAIFVSLMCCRTLWYKDAFKIGKILSD